MTNPVFSDNVFRSVNTSRNFVSSSNSTSKDAVAGLTYGDVLEKTLINFCFMLVGGVVGWFYPPLMLPAIIISFVLGIVNSVKYNPSPTLILLYSFLEGVCVGTLSVVFEKIYPGIVMQAVLGTLSVFATVLILYCFRVIRESALVTRIFFVTMIGYLVFSLVNLILMVTGVVKSSWGLNTSITFFGIPLGLIIGILAVIMASYSLVMDFTFIENAVNMHREKKIAWYAAYGLVLDLVWLYIEILRILAILQKDADDD